MRAAVLIFLFCTGCAQVEPSRIDASRLPAVYSNGDGFTPRSLELKRDGTYVYDQLTDNVTKVGEDLVFEGSWGLRGRWTFVAPDRIELIVDGRPEKVVVFVRPSEKYGLAILEPDLFPDILQRWQDDGNWGYLKKDTPATVPGHMR